MEILLTIIWVLLGLWYCHKRDWYDHHRNNDEEIQGLSILITIIISPILIIWRIISEFIIRKWK